MTYGSTGAGARASIASISSMLIPRRLRDQAWVDLTPLASANCVPSIHDLIDAVVTIKVVVFKTVGVKVGNTAIH